MKKLFKILLTVTLVMSLFGCSTTTTEETSGAKTVSASAEGFGGEVTVELTIENDTLTNVVVTGEKETENVGGLAIEKMPAEMLETNSIDVDGVTGATFTSNAILEAAAKALEESGVTLAAKETSSTVEAKEDVTADVVVVGGGLAGLAAAISAKENGAENVVLLEKLAFVGGCAALSGGVITRSRQDGDPDEIFTAEELADYFTMRTSGKANPAVIQAYVDNSVDTFNWIGEMYDGEAQYSRFEMNPKGLYGLTPAREGVASGAGAQLIEALQNGADKAGVEILLSAPVTDLVVEDGKVTGATVTYADGSTQNFFGKGGVILTTGGFAYSTDLLAKYSSKNAELITSYASAGTTGDALEWAEKLGADIQFGDDWDSCGSFSLAFFYEESRIFSKVLLNNKGERFIPESSMQPEIYLEMRHQLADGAESFFTLTDRNMDADMEETWIANGAFVCETLEEVSEKTGMPLEALTETIETYNANKGTENDELGKPGEFMLGLEAPYIVLPVIAMRTTTIGGLVTDEYARVLDTNGNPIDGLYAAGEVANYSFFYNVYSCCGSANGDAAIFGRIAGAQAAENLK